MYWQTINLAKIKKQPQKKSAATENEVFSSKMPQTVEQFRKHFNEKLHEISEKKGRTASGFLSAQRKKFIALRLNELDQNPLAKKSSEDYRLTRKYKLSKTNLSDGSVSVHLRCAKSNRLISSIDTIFDEIRTQHLITGHGARDITNNKLKETHANVTKEIVQLYVDLCETCAMKKRKIRKSLVIKPIISNLLNSRCQIDLIDMQSTPDGDYKHICHYQDHLTKFSILRPHKTKEAVEVAFTLQDIFCLLGAPKILQSDNGREFANKVVEELTKRWPEMKIVHGKPRHSQSQVRNHLIFPDKPINQGREPGTRECMG